MAVANLPLTDVISYTHNLYRWPHPFPNSSHGFEWCATGTLATAYNYTCIYMYMYIKYQVVSIIMFFLMSQYSLLELK